MENFRSDGIDNLSFFHPTVTLSGVCDIMAKYNNQYGIYLLRMSCKTPGTYCISVRHDRNILHFVINRKGDKFFIGDASFNDIPSLVCNFSNFPLVNDQGFLDVYLKHPICRWHGVSSWEESTLRCCAPHIYLTSPVSSHVSSKPSTPESDWEITNLTDLDRVRELHYVNAKSGPTGKAPGICDERDKINARVSLRNGWVLEPFLAFKSPDGEIYENLPRPVWLSLPDEDRVAIQELSNKFTFLEIKKKLGSSRGHRLD